MFEDRWFFTDFPWVRSTLESMTTNSDSTARPAERIPREIWILVIAAFIIALGYGFISPILP